MQKDGEENENCFLFKKTAYRVASTVYLQCI